MLIFVAKLETPWGVLPILEVDGKQLCETLAILRFIGREYGLGGKDEFQTAKCDEYVDAMNDFRLGNFTPKVVIYD